MAKIKISKETAVPSGGSIIPNTIYMVQVGGGFMEVYMSNTLGDSLNRIYNEADIQALIDASLAGISGVQIVNTIAERDALNPSTNIQVLVIDASADPDVTSGAATYIYRQSTDTYIKISEAESLDVVLDWANIQNGPASSPSAIDNAVTLSHTHANKTQLDLIGEDGDNDITYNGVKVANEYTNTNW